MLKYISIFFKGESGMLRHFTLEYSVDEEWHIGRLKENPGVLSQDESLQELEENIKDAYKLMLQEDEED